VNARPWAKRAMMAVTFLLLAFDVAAQERPSQDSGSNAGMQGTGPGQHRKSRGRTEDFSPQGMSPMGRSAQFAPGDAGAPHGVQMSREERRQLRNDVREAGRDLYPERRRTRHREQNQAPPERPPVPAQ
jgi:hypothetical protein